MVADLRALLSTGAHPQARMLLHTLKGNAGTLGATALALEAGRLETVYADAATNTDPPPLAELETLVRSTAASLSQAIEALDPVSARSAANVPSASAQDVPVARATPQVLAALQELVGLLQASDLAALQRFAELRATLQSLPAESIDRLDEALQNLDFEAAHAVCLKYIDSAGESAHPSHAIPHPT